MSLRSRLRGVARRLLKPAAASEGPSSAGYTVTSREEATAAGSEGWNDASVAARQDAAFRKLLDAMHAGEPRVDLAVLGAAVRCLGLAPGATLLEVGCGSGYCADVLAHLAPGAVAYTGLDSSAAMIALAHERAPGGSFVVGDAVALPFGDGAFDVVLNGVALMHIPDYERAIAEAARVARSWCIFHTVPVLTHRATTWLVKQAYGRPTVEVILNESELLAAFAACGLEVVATATSLPYDLAAVLGEPTVTRTYSCRKR